jgi:hypothetical protein
MDDVIKKYVVTFLSSNFHYLDSGYDELVKDKYNNEHLTLNQLKYVVYKVFNGDEVILDKLVSKWWLAERKSYKPVEE